MIEFACADDVFLDAPCATHNEVLMLLSEEAACAEYVDNAKALRDAMYDAERAQKAYKQGNCVLLPVCDACVHQACAMMLHGFDPIKGWPSADKKAVDVVLVTLLPLDASEQDTRCVQALVKRFGDEKFRKSLLRLDDEEELADFINSSVA